MQMPLFKSTTPRPKEGCVFSGSLHIPNTDIDQTYFDVNVSNCGQITRILGGARSTR